MTWRLPDRSKRKRTFRTERQAREFEAKLLVGRAGGETIDPRAGRIPLSSVYRSWLASRPDLSAKVRRGYTDNWRLRVGPRFASWPVSKIDHQSIQAWVNEMSASGLGPRSVRWTHSVLRMCLDHALESGQLIGKNPATRTKFPPMKHTAHTYLTAPEVAALAAECGTQGDVVLILAYTGLRFGELIGLNVEDVDLVARRVRIRRSMTQVGGKLVEGNTKSRAGRRTVPIPARLIPTLANRIAGRDHGEPAVTSPKGARLSLENWKRAVDWKSAITAINRPTLRVHDLRHTYASLSRKAGADLRLLQVAMGHASITVTAHTYADLYDDELDGIAAALDSLNDAQEQGVEEFGPILAPSDEDSAGEEEDPDADNNA
ncbi:MAG TPA: tyrosine-type recombinase/integrase [Aldersonia sp.]